MPRELLHIVVYAYIGIFAIGASKAGWERIPSRQGREPHPNTLGDLRE
jgi:hypothetical protein